MFNFIKKIPGGLIIVPMMAVSVVATVFPAALSCGDLVSALFSTAATNTFIAVLLFLAGSQLRPGQIPSMLLRGGVLSVARVAVGVLACVAVSALCGLDGLLGISLLALVVALSTCNPGVYLAAVCDCGDEKDVPVFGILNLIAVPAVPLLILGLSGGQTVDLANVLSTLVPFVLGFVLGNADAQLRALFDSATPAVLFLAGANFGASVNWLQIFSTGVSGLVLTLIYFVVSLPVMLAADKLLLRRPGYAAVSMTSLAGVAVVMPGYIGAALPQYSGYVAAATGQVALCMVLSNLASVFLIRLATKWWGGGKNA